MILLKSKNIKCWSLLEMILFAMFMTCKKSQKKNNLNQIMKIYNSIQKLKNENIYYVSFDVIGVKKSKRKNDQILK
jgi:ATP-dependent Zn protease